MTKYQLYRFSLFASIILILFGVYFKIQHHPGGEDFLITGLILGLLFIFIGMEDVYKDPKRSLPEKAAWLIGFISLIGGIIYYFIEIKKHLPEKKTEDH